MPRSAKWRMTEKCVDCPFAETGPGAFLRKTLGEKRWTEITDSLKNNEHFTCHKTSDETGDGSNLVCAGSIEWQEARGYSANYVRICKRIEWIRKQEKETT